MGWRGSPIRGASSASEERGFKGSLKSKTGSLSVKGRHDPCVLPQAPPLLDGMATIIVADTFFFQQGRMRSRAPPVTPGPPATKKAKAA